MPADPQKPSLRLVDELPAEFGPKCVWVEEPDDGIAYVALAKDALVKLAEGGSPPVIILGLEPRADGIGFDMVLRRPTIFELTAAIDDLPKLEPSA